MSKNHLPDSWESEPFSSSGGIWVVQHSTHDNAAGGEVAGDGVLQAW